MNHFLNGSGKAQIDDFRQPILWKTQTPLFPLLLEDGHVQCSPTAYEGETLCLNEFGRKTRRKLENRKFCTKVNKKSKNNRKENPRPRSKVHLVIFFNGSITFLKREHSHRGSNSKHRFFFLQKLKINVSHFWVQNEL